MALDQLENYGAGANPTGNPIGGGIGYNDIIQPDDPRVIAVVRNKAGLINALGRATAGDVVYIDGSANIDMTGTFDVRIPAGVTLASNRGEKGAPGGRIYQRRVSGDGSGHLRIFLANGPNVRVTGLRIQGPDPTTARVPDSRSAIWSYHANFRVDNCEIYEFGYAGIRIQETGPNQGQYIHHNHIHSNQRNGLGYGIAIVDSEVLIEANLFDYNRHSITAVGRINCAYEARYNIIGPNGQSAYFDMHQDPDDPQWGGDWIWVHHNTFLGTKQNALNYRGRPRTGAWVEYNVMNSRDQMTGPVRQTFYNLAWADRSYGNVFVSNNIVNGKLFNIGPVNYYRDIGGYIEPLPYPANPKGYTLNPSYIPTPKPTPTPKPIIKETYGASANPTGNPIGGGAGYNDIIRQTDPRIIAIVNDKAGLIQALESASNGDVVFIDGSANIDMTGTFNVRIPAGVTLASNRGERGAPGGKIYQTRASGDLMRSARIFQTDGENIRITGLRIQGPDSNTARVSDGRSAIWSYHSNFEIDNCEIYEFGFAAIRIQNTGVDSDQHIHHNNIHTNQADGFGYGIVIVDSEVLIEANLFDKNRFSITATGGPETGYEARYNIIGQNSHSASFSMAQDSNDPKWGGNWVRIHHNTFKGEDQYAFLQRGLPRTGAWIEYNEMNSRNFDAPVLQRYYNTVINPQMGRIYMNSNIINGVYTLYGPVSYRENPRYVEPLPYPDFEVTIFN